MLFIWYIGFFFLDRNKKAWDVKYDYLSLLAYHLAN